MRPDLSVFAVIILVVLLTVIVDRLLLRPLTRVTAERERAIRSARELAEQAANRAAEATREFEERTAAARTEVYRQMDDMRRVALERRQELLSGTRAEVERTVADASARVQAEAEAARQKLRQEADSLGEAAAERILGRKVS
ncbi:MAG: ATP synthase F0 subunit B [Acidobacteriota bacterium]